VRKLTEKRVEVLVANDVSVPGIGFEHDENAVLILHHDGRRHEVPRAPKSVVAEAVLAAVVAHLPGAGLPGSD
jgi:phosphopantothenoylcysteine decarboxylase/phosphopantothenate--cysteine ligase